jgi:hypothetical protein
MSEAKKSTDRKEIKDWAEKNGGVPSIIKGTENEGKGEGVLRIHFPKKSESNDDFEVISWDDFFKELEEKKLSVLIDPDTTFSKIVNRD